MSQSEPHTVHDPDGVDAYSRRWITAELLAAEGEEWHRGGGGMRRYLVPLCSLLDVPDDVRDRALARQPPAPDCDQDDALDDLLRGLPPRHREVLRLYYGREPLTCLEIGRQLGRSESRIWMVVQEALGMLRTAHGVATTPTATPAPTEDAA